MEYLQFFGPLSLFLATGSVAALVGINLKKSK